MPSAPLARAVSVTAVRGADATMTSSGVPLGSRTWRLQRRFSFCDATWTRSTDDTRGSRPVVPAKGGYGATQGTFLLPPK
eukprot:5015254-Prymnesium_polylepis.1